jgi:hypothetical protein
VPSVDAAAIALAAGKSLADSDAHEAATWLTRARRAAPGSAPGSEADRSFRTCAVFRRSCVRRARKRCWTRLAGGREGDPRGEEQLLRRDSCSPRPRSRRRRRGAAPLALDRRRQGTRRSRSVARGTRRARRDA